MDRAQASGAALGKGDEVTVGAAEADVAGAGGGLVDPVGRSAAGPPRAVHADSATATASRAGTQTVDLAASTVHRHTGEHVLGRQHRRLLESRILARVDTVR